MIKKKFSPQFMTVGLICLLGLAMQVKGETERSFAPAEQDSKGRYINLDRNLPGVSIKVTAPFFARRVLTAFKSRDGAPQRIANDGEFLRENATHSEPTVTWVGHATLLVQMEHLSFLTDPIWSNRPSPVPFAGPNRYVKPGIAIEDLPPIDFVIISHNHYDHLDLPTLRKLSKRDPDTVFFVPLGNGELLRKTVLIRFKSWIGVRLPASKTRPFTVCLPSTGASAALPTPEKHSGLPGR